MSKLLSSLFKTDEMKPSSKGILLVIGAYVMTISVAIFIILLAIMILMMGSYGCNDMGRALLALWAMIAVVFLLSIVVAGVTTWRIIPGTVGRLALVATYGVALLVSYAVLAFGLMVIFNC